MKNRDIILLIGAGILQVTGHSLPAAQYYKLIRWKQDVQRAYRIIGKAEEALIAEAGIRPEETSQQGGHLLLQPKTADGGEDTERLALFGELREKLLDDRAEMSERARIPMEFYKALYDENHKEVAGHMVDIFADPDVEALTIDNLFIAEEGE